MPRKQSARFMRLRRHMPRASRLAESTPSAKLMVRGRASRSRRKSDVITIKAIADYLPTMSKKAGGHQNPWVNEMLDPRHLFGRTERPRPPSNSEAPLTARPERREGRQTRSTFIKCKYVCNKRTADNLFLL